MKDNGMKKLKIERGTIKGWIKVKDIKKDSMEEWGGKYPRRNL